jgi:hypothetical protein
MGRMMMRMMMELTAIRPVIKLPSYPFAIAQRNVVKHMTIRHPSQVWYGWYEQDDQDQDQRFMICPIMTEYASVEPTVRHNGGGKRMGSNGDSR